MATLKEITAQYNNIATANGLKTVSRFATKTDAENRLAKLIKQVKQATIETEPAAKPAETAPVAKPAKAAKPAETAPVAKPAKAAETAPVAKPAKAAETAPVAKPAKAAETAPAAKAKREFIHLTEETLITLKTTSIVTGTNKVFNHVLNKVIHISSVEKFFIDMFNQSDVGEATVLPVEDIVQNIMNGFVTKTGIIPDRDWALRNIRLFMKKGLLCLVTLKDVK